MIKIIRSFFSALWVLLTMIILASIGLLVVWFTPNTVFILSRFWSWLIFKGLFGVTVEYSGRENVPEGQSYIFVANHQSAFDIPLLILGNKSPTRFLAKKELTRIPLFGWCMKAMGHIIIDRQNIHQARAGLARALERLKKERLSIIAFPEGTRSKDGNLSLFKKGTFILAIESGLPVVPVTISGAYDVFPKKKWFYNKGILRVHFHPPIETTPYTVERKEELSEKVRNIIAKQLETNLI
jgi:1-acyl-sn-glycerol-3-phosphate acyltransferase